MAHTETPGASPIAQIGTRDILYGELPPSLAAKLPLGVTLKTRQRPAPTTLAPAEYDRERLGVAYHEAGHVVAAVALGLPVTEAWLFDDTYGPNGGVVMLSWPIDRTPETDTDREVCARNIIVTLAGVVAQTRAGFAVPFGVVQAHETEALLLALCWKAETTFADAQRGAAVALRNATRLIDERWQVVEAIAAALLRCGRVTESRLQELATCHGYRQSDGTWRYLDGASGPLLSLAATGDIEGAPIVVEQDARTRVLTRLVGVGGDGALDPEFGNVFLNGTATVAGGGGGGGGSVGVVGDWVALIQLLGGDAEVPFFYDGRYNTSAGASPGDVEGIDDVRGSSGYGPFLGFGNDAAHDSVTGAITFDTNNAFVSNGAFAGVDLSGPFTLVYVGTVDSGGSGRKFIAAVGDPSGTPTTVLGIRNSGGVITTEALVSGVRYALASGVAEHATTVRVALAVQNGNIGLLSQVPNDPPIGLVMATQMTPTSAYIALMEQTNADFGNRGEGEFRALFGINHVVTASEVAAILSWANVYRGATTA
jgi:hypothetical protein